MMQTILSILQVLLSVALIALILIQHGRGADAGAAFGSGASATVFGARGSGSFLSRLTAILATLFFLTSMGLAYYAARTGNAPGLMDKIEIPQSLPDTPVKAVAPGADSDVPSVSTDGGGSAPGTDVPAPPGTHQANGPAQQ
ncbi:preprotein translocase subunit SecG [Caldichromatium japonicum]|uniref:Protein-export membrane protein SecG n=1 Tax=Caldichromatium japonicum TaxID=2699430 RepID=A0A6G7VGG6_9GAMM|nr:preprotein translocase subunit SecG [Caldichromatium japonicum]QIK39084.1 preprotein translocase subunit SecG [Caldichromatium japonicum]